MTASQKRYLPFVICGIAALFYPYEFMVRVMPSAMTTDLMRDYGMSAAGLGVMASLFYWGYTIMQIPAGILFDRFGPRTLISFAMAVTSLATLLFGWTDSFYIACFSRFLIGFGASFAFIGTLVLASRWFAAKYFAMIVGLVQFLGSLGAIVGEQPIAHLVHHFPWRDVVYGTAMVGLLITVLMWLLIRDHPSASPKHRQTHHLKDELRGFPQVYRKKQTWWLALYALCSWAPITIFAALWGIPFLAALYQTSAASAAAGLTILWLGVALGSPFVGWWSDYMGRRCLPLAICMATGFIVSIMIIYVNNISWPVMYFLLFLFGFAASGQALSFGVVQDNNPPTVAGTAIGFNNMAVIIGGMLCQPLVGLLLKYNWAGGMLHGAPVYQLHNYRIALIAVPLVFFIGTVTAIFGVKETFCKHTYDKNNNSDTSNAVFADEGQAA